MIWEHSFCAVQEGIEQLRELLEKRDELHPRGRRILENVFAAFQDIATGNAEGSHLSTIERLLQELATPIATKEDTAIASGLTAFIQANLESFESHIETRNCPAGACTLLTPAPCQMACPAGIDVPTYISLIGRGRDAEAIEVIRQDNPLPWICGLVCTRPCETNCVRGMMDAPVSIKALKAFAARQAFSGTGYVNPQPGEPNHIKVCVVGSGPGGLSAAYFLALKGYQVRVIEALPQSGGMLRVGIPRYRLPGEVIDREVSMIEDLGVEFRFNTRLGRDITVAQLRAEGFEAFFLAIGAHAGIDPSFSGAEEFSGVYNAIGFLRAVAQGEIQPPGEKVVVIGGGNVAIDAARTCVRLGCRQVTVVYRRTRDAMPADLEEVEQAEEEGVRFEFLTIPMAVQGRDRTIRNLHCQRVQMTAGPDARRQSLAPVANSDFTIEADAVINAIGQRVDRRWLEELDLLAWTQRDTIQVDPVTMETNLPGIFAAGDAVTGPATVIEAIGGGKRAAVAMDRYLQGIPRRSMKSVPVRRGRVEPTEIAAATKMALKRPEMPLLPDEQRRTSFRQVELGLTEDKARAEAQRCLRCDICRRCGLCVSICRDHMGVNALSMGYFDCNSGAPTDFQRTAQSCIGCGACAINCPNGAMVIEDRGEERILSLCGTVLSRQPLVRCEICGTIIGTPRYLDFIRRRIADPTVAAEVGRLCDACAHRKWSAGHVEKEQPWPFQTALNMPVQENRS